MSDIDTDTEAPPRRLEFVCAVCLRSIHALDTDKPPRCERCGVRMVADSDEPPRRPNKGATTRRPSKADTA